MIKAEDITKAVKEMREEGYNPSELIVNEFGFRDIRELPNYVNVDVDVGGGLFLSNTSSKVGEIFGIPVIFSPTSRHPAVIVDSNKPFAKSVEGKKPEVKYACGICALLGRPCKRHESSGINASDYSARPKRRVSGTGPGGWS